MKDVVDKCGVKGRAINVGTITGNKDCVYRAKKISPSREKAESAIIAVYEYIVATASISEPLQVDYIIAAVGDEVKSDPVIAFPYQAEKIIFELSL